LKRLRSSLACAVAVSCVCVTSPAFAQAPVPASPDTNSFKSLITDTVSDFKRLPSRENLMWLTLGGTIAATGRAKDWDVTNGFSATTRMDGMFAPGETIGGARAQMGGAIAAYTIGRLSGRPRVASLGADLISAQIVAQTMTAGIKLAARRSRPDGGEFSFPSGHTSVTFATATVMQRHFGWKAGIPSYALATYVAASRVHVKRHFLSDVAFGAAVGIVAGRTVTVGRGRARFAVSPAAAPGHAGVSFVLLDAR
jgi:membrane-associated phospholipid phosphatase